jgi:hypothetical protein
MNSEFILAIVRHVLSAVAAWLATTGYLEASQVQGFVGAVIFLITVVWSVINKLRAEKAIDTALLLPAKSSRDHLKEVMKF